MTTILAYANGRGTVWMAGDSQASNGHYTRFKLAGRPKIFRVDNLLIGGSGSHHAIQLIRHLLVLPLLEQKFCEPEQYLVAHFAPAVRSLLKKHDTGFSQDGDYTALLIGYAGRIFTCGSDYNITNPEPQARAIGNGGDYALGAFLAYRDEGRDVEEAMLKAMAIAGDNDATSGPPYYVEVLKRDSKPES